MQISFQVSLSLAGEEIIVLEAYRRQSMIFQFAFVILPLPANNILNSSTFLPLSFRIFHPVLKSDSDSSQPTLQSVPRKYNLLL